jgi:glycerate kinase
MTRVLLAPDKFKGTLTAAEVAGHLADGIRSAAPGTGIVTVPVSDGGDGLLAAFTAAGFQPVTVAGGGAGPPGLTSAVAYARRGAAAVVEFAAVAGLSRPAPLTATSRGAGAAIAAALDAGCTRIVLGLGGSASTDGGLGMVQALGARVLDSRGRPVAGNALGAAAATRLDLSGLHPGLGQATLEVACDVDNPLTGPAGAAAVYGPQKGADPEQVRWLDAALSHWADVVAASTGSDHRGDPGAGAAGGAGFAAIALLGARPRPGAQLVLDAVRFGAAVAGADLVVTGEGSLDEQTLHGKAPAAVAEAARTAGVPVVAVAGRCLLAPARLRDAGFGAVYGLQDEAGTPGEALAAPGPLLRRIGARLMEKGLR